ncbi:AI-2E family transporter [Rhodobacteraceae bacterium DSL-40]|uniref:AI-2E family transporter n=1 Tax=Amaricoccus sp. B4 TaxID=3368557 RepID=UPI000DADFC25
MVSRRKQLWFWGIGLVMFVAVLWTLGNTLLPFVLGAAIAYFLDPVADRLERLGLSRVIATAIISIVAVLGFVLTTLLVVPALVDQFRQAADAIPGFIDSLQALIAERFPRFSSEDQLLRRALQSLEGSLANIGPEVVNSLLTSSLAVVDFIILLVVAPVVAFYLLLDWDRMIARIDSWLPRQHAGTIRGIATEIDRVLAGFVRGQFTVCMILGTFYAIGLSLVGLPFGFLIGMLAGFLSFIPYVGSLTGGVLSIGIALFSFWGEPVWIFATAAIFGFGQFVEGNILSPKLIGKSVGLHPVILILALSVFGKLFGFAGMLVAVPAAAALGVVGRFLVEQYLESPLYSGVPQIPDPNSVGLLPPEEIDGGIEPPEAT